MKLNKLSDYVLEKQMKFDSGFINVTEFADSVISFTEFITQSLNLWMFVPCNQNGELMKEPYDTGMWSKWTGKERSEYCDSYEQAKERILFKGFKPLTLKGGKLYGVKVTKPHLAPIDTLDQDEFGLYFHDSSMNKSRVKTIEDLLNFHPIELTQMATSKVKF